MLVLDEADRLLEMGFKEEIAEIVRMTPKKRQTMLFSATLSDQVRRLAALSLRQPVRLAADAASSVPTKLCQQIVRLKVRPSDVPRADICLLFFSEERVANLFYGLNPFASPSHSTPAPLTPSQTSFPPHRPLSPPSRRPT